MGKKKFHGCAPIGVSSKVAAKSGRISDSSILVIFVILNYVLKNKMWFVSPY